MNSSSETFLRVHGLAVGYNRVSILEDVTFSAHAGDVIGIIGGNGAGKSTLLRTIAGVIPPIRGDVFLQGKNMAGKSALERLREFNLCYLPQHNRQIANLTVAENLRLAQWGAGTRNEREEKIWSILSARPFDQLKDSLNEYASVLSGGQSLLLGLATLLLQDGRLLLLDEPSDGLDEGNRALVIEMIKAMKAQNRVVLVVEQVLRIVFAFSDRVFVMTSENHEDSSTLSGAQPYKALRELSREALSKIRDLYATNRILSVEQTELVQSLIRSY